MSVVLNTGVYVSLSKSVSALCAVVAVIGKPIVSFDVAPLEKPRVFRVIFVAITATIRSIRPDTVFLSCLCLSWYARSAQVYWA